MIDTRLADGGFTLLSNWAFVRDGDRYRWTRLGLVVEADHDADAETIRVTITAPDGITETAFTIDVSPLRTPRCVAPSSRADIERAVQERLSIQFRDYR